MPEANPTDAAALANANGTMPEGDQGDQGDQGAPPEDAEAMRSQLTELRQADRNARRRVKELENELATMRQATMTETERAIAEATASARQEADNEWRGRFLTLRIERLAATKMADPSDAVHLIDAAALAADADDREIDAMIDALIVAKPYLANGKALAPPPTLDRGPTPASGPPTASSQMNQLMRRRR